MAKNPKLRSGSEIGDYILKELVGESAHTRTWYADQISIKRSVIVQSLRDALLLNENARYAFLNDVRAKARVDFPLIGTVVEALELEERCFYVRERLEGVTLEEMQTEGQQLTPSQAVHILKQIAESYIYLESMNFGTLPIHSHHVYVDNKFVTRLVNMVVNQPYDIQVVEEDRCNLGAIIQDLLNKNQPGATRVNSLCEIMQDRERQAPISWQQVASLSDQVTKQLRSSPSGTSTTLTHSKKQRGIAKSTVVAIAVIASLVIVITLVALLVSFPKASVARKLDQMTYVDVRNIQLNGESVSLAPYHIDSHEVTIEEYAEFLKSELGAEMDVTKKKKLKKFIEDCIPVGVKEWPQIYSAASEGKNWNGRKMELNCPIFGVSYYAAKAYANWKTSLSTDSTYTLPSEQQWLASMHATNVSELTAGGWGEVDESPNDVTKNGLHGMVGGVSEWTSSEELGMDGRIWRPVIRIASAAGSSGDSLRRETLQHRGITRTDLGFRLIREIKTK